MSTELARRAAAGDTGPEVARWIADSMRRHRAGDDLYFAFGLDRGSRLRERNQALQDAAALLAPGAEPWHAAGLLGAAVRRYAARIAPLLERDPAHELAPADAALRRAFDTGQRVPTTQRNLYELLR